MYKRRKARKAERAELRRIAREQKTGFLTALKQNSNVTRTENGAKTWRSSGSDVLDLFACVGAIRHLDEREVLRRFYRAWAENRDLAMKILFYARDVRGGLGERQVFRTVLRSLAAQEPESVRRNLELIPFYGRYDDLLALLGTPCEADVLAFIKNILACDMASLAAGYPVSLMAKWLPSINASSEETRQQALTVARGIGMSNAEYRKTLSVLRGAEQILENRLRERDYSFSYTAQPSGAMFRYRRAFAWNDRERYNAYLDKVQAGNEKMHTAALMPYELVRAALNGERKIDNGRQVILYAPIHRLEMPISEQERKSLEVMWNALPDFTNGRNALAVVDTSASMYWTGIPRPAEVAFSLGLYFAERNTSAFRGHFITFSRTPRLVEIKGADFVDRVRYCQSFWECSTTNIQAVFELILNTAVTYEMEQKDLPETLYIISDMEFDKCAVNADMTNFEYAKKLYEEHSYRLPNLVFWNVQSRNRQVPVKMNDRGVALVSGFSPRVFSMVMQNDMDPWQFMMKVIGSERYDPVRA